VDNRAVLAAFNQQIRSGRDRPPGWEHVDGVVRIVPEDRGWAGVIWSDLDATTADAAITAQVARFAGRSWEWKHYSYDRPEDLPQRLLAAGLTPEDPEALLIAEVAELDLDVPPPDGVRLVPVTDEATIAALVHVHNEVFGGDYRSVGEMVARRLTEQPGLVPALVAMDGTTPVSSGRIDYAAGTDFASLWGGGTMPEWRGRGIFRALVAARAALAAAAGFRYLQVDASDDSRPILTRLGFAHLATTTPYVTGA
jgi:GNAT superfamily N-acetyltransferase